MRGLDAEKIKEAARDRFLSYSGNKPLPANVVRALDAYLGAFVAAVNEALDELRPAEGTRFLTIHTD